MRETFPTPDRTQSAENNTTEDDDNDVFAERMDEMEVYWGLVDTERFVQKVSVAYDVGVNEDGYAVYKDVSDDSPIAEDGLYYYQEKREQGQELSDKRDSGELNDDQTLPEYKDQFGEPEHDHTYITAENAENYGLEPEQFEEGEAIHLPDAYEPPVDDDGNLLVWYDDQPVTTDRVIESLEKVDGISNKRAGKVLNQLQEDGIIDSDI